MKEYPIYIYTTDLGQSVMFAYRMSEDEMLRTNNGLYHYDYFADACIEYIKNHCEILEQPLYKRERGMSTVMTSTDIFFYNIFKPKKDRIHFINPIINKYNKTSDVNGSIPFNQLIHDRYFNIVITDYDKLDMICLQYFGTRAYTDCIAAANGISPNAGISVGQVLKIPLRLENILNKSAIKLFHGSNVLSFNSIFDVRQANIDSVNMDGTLIRIGKNLSYVYYKGEYIRIYNYF